MDSSQYALLACENRPLHMMWKRVLLFINVIHDPSPTQGYQASLLPHRNLTSFDLYLLNSAGTDST